MDTNILNRIKQTLATSLPKNGQAILFGSQARGDANCDSDWDILIIVDKDELFPQDYDTITYPLTKLGWDLNVEINPIMYTRKDWNANYFTPFYYNIQQDGIAIA